MAEDEEKKIDSDIAKWALEFLVRNMTDSSLLKILMANSSLPLPVDDSRWEKTLLLRSLKEKDSKDSVSEEMLGWLEILEELDRKDGIAVSESMKRAYCAVAVESTVNQILDAVNRIWVVRIGALLGKSELVTGEILKIRGYMETVLRDMEPHSAVLKWNADHDAVESVKEYLEEAMVALGPSFLELVASKQLGLECGENSNKVGACSNGEERACEDGGNGGDGSHVEDGCRLESGEILRRNDRDSVETGDGSKGGGGDDGTGNGKEDHLREYVGDGDKGQCGKNSCKVGECSNGEERVCEDGGNGGDGSHVEDGCRLESGEILRRNDRDSVETGDGSKDGDDGAGNSKEDHLPEYVGDGDKGEGEHILKRKAEGLDKVGEGYNGGYVAKGTPDKDGGKKLEGVRIGKRKDIDSGRIGENAVKRKRWKCSAVRAKHRPRPAKIHDMEKADEIVDLTVEADAIVDLTMEYQDGFNAVLENQIHTGLANEAGKESVTELGTNAEKNNPSCTTTANAAPGTGAEKNNASCTTAANATAPGTNAEKNNASCTTAANAAAPGTNAEKNNASCTTAANAAATDPRPPTSPPPNRRSGRVLPSFTPPKQPPRQPIDPLLLPRRKNRRWTKEEEAALYDGVQQFGMGFWKEILRTRPEKFNMRTEVDLKDKWRNMSQWKPNH